jgi:hypothetical protein
MNLQIKHLGAWSNVAAFTVAEQADVMQAAANLLRALRQPRTVLRVADGGQALFYCAAPDYLWREA